MTQARKTLATAWLDGCSGCHMSFLDIDERLVALAEVADLVYSPLVDSKTLPDMVDILLVEGAVSSEEDWHKIRMLRQHARVLVALGDCAVTANVPAMRNPFALRAVYERAYLENADRNIGIPLQVVPPLRPHAVPVHHVVAVDLFVPGCPPSADTIHYMLTELLAGRTPDLSNHAHFGG